MAREQEGWHVPLSSMRVKPFAGGRDGCDGGEDVAGGPLGRGWRLWNFVWLGMVEDGYMYVT